MAKPLLLNWVIALLLSLELVLLSCSAKKTGFERFDSNSLIKEGRGVDDFQIETLLVTDVKTRLGDNFELINHDEYSIELFYKQFGVSFYYLTKEPTKIFAISFNSDFQGETERGFSSKEMLVRDMIKIYGQPKWRFLTNEEILYAHYDGIGISFSVKGKGKPPFKVLNYSKSDSATLYKIHLYYDSVYNADKIFEISVGLPGTSY